jgi:hypothetical protein
MEMHEEMYNSTLQEELFSSTEPLPDAQFDVTTREEVECHISTTDPTQEEHFDDQRLFPMLFQEEQLVDQTPFLVVQADLPDLTATLVHEQEQSREMKTLPQVHTAGGKEQEDSSSPSRNVPS